MSEQALGRALAIVGGATVFLWGILAVAWYLRIPWAVGLWPWPEVPMTFVFLSSIGAAIVAAWAVIGTAREPGSLAGIGANIAVVGCGTAAFGTWLSTQGTPGTGAYIALGVALLLFGALLLVWARRQPLRDARSMPSIARAGFAFFVCALVAAGSLLAFQVQVFPWRLHPLSATMIGIIFLGAAASFAYGVVHPKWVHTAPALAGFLAYDLVLFIPYARLFMSDAGTGVVDDFYGSEQSGGVNVTSLVIYLGVLALSALLALHLFLLNPRTRWFGRSSKKSA
jgi:hypothetical protein